MPHEEETCAGCGEPIKKRETYDVVWIPWKGERVPRIRHYNPDCIAALNTKIKAAREAA